MAYQDRDFNGSILSGTPIFSMPLMWDRMRVKKVFLVILVYYL